MDTVEATKNVLTLGKSAEGGVDPASRKLNRETLANVERDVLKGCFDVPVIEGVFLPCGCIDGRCPHDEAVFNPVPNAAGGTLSLLVGELLTTESNVARSAINNEEALASLIEFLRTQKYDNQIGGHTGPSHDNPEASGCGANDQLAAIFGQIVHKSDAILQTLRTLNIPVSATSFDAMIGKAKVISAREGYFMPGTDVAKTLKAASIEGNCPRVEGAHNEVLIRLNTVEGTTLDRRALKAAYGDDYQIFNVDVWSLQKAAESLSYSDQEAQDKFAAMVVYQIATALQLCGPSMRVVVR